MDVLVRPILRVSTDEDVRRTLKSNVDALLKFWWNQGEFPIFVTLVNHFLNCRRRSMVDVLKTIVAHKLVEIAAAKERCSLAELERQLTGASPVMDFAAAIRNDPKISLIAEVKRASPSAGLIREDFDPVAIARTYASAGATCISVLTDEHFFQGHLDFLRAIRAAVNVPLLRKDFVLDEYQVVQARVAGADAVLLIAECLDEKRLQQLQDRIVELGMTALVELHDGENLEKVLAVSPSLVGVNNRNLKTFEVDLEHTLRMRERISSDILLVGESGIRTRDDVLRLERAGVNAMLVGESLMRQADIGAAVRELLG